MSSEIYKKYLSSVDTKDLLDQEVVDITAKCLRDAVQKKDRATFLVPGGSTPLSLFEKIKHIDLPWDKISIGVIDDRINIDDINQSNIYSLKKNLLNHIPDPKKILDLKENVEWVSAKEFWPADVTWVGVGDDGHVASLFDKKDFSLQQNILRTVSPLDPPERVSLPLSKIIDTKNLFVIINSDRKKDLLPEWMKKDTAIKSLFMACNENNTSDYNVALYCIK